MDFVSIPKPLPLLLEEELQSLRVVLDNLDRSYRSAAAPYIERMAQIESMREYSHIVTASQNDRLPHGSREMLTKDAAS